MRKSMRLFLECALILGLASCGEERRPAGELSGASDESSGAGGGSSNKPGNKSGNSSTAGLSFKDVKPIFAEVCVGCHLAEKPPKPDWTIYENALGKKDLIKQYLKSGNMPRPPVKILANQKATIIAWIDQGAPKEATEKPNDGGSCGGDGGGSNPQATPPPVVPPQGPAAATPEVDTPSAIPIPEDSEIPSGLPNTFEDKYRPYIFEKRCKMCHNAESDICATEGATCMPNWLLFSNVVAKKESMLDRISRKPGTEGAMPMTGPLPRNEQRMLENWLKGELREKADITKYPEDLPL